MANSKFTVDGIAFYARVVTPDTAYEPVYSIDVVVSDEEAVRLEGLGLKAVMMKNTTIFKKHDGVEGKIFKIKRKIETKSGVDLGPPVVVDSEGNVFSDLIGNGSKVRVHASLINYDNKYGKGALAGLNAVQIIDLVPFEKKSSEKFSKIEGGFVAPTVVDNTEGNSGDFI